MEEWSRTLSAMTENTIQLKWQFLEFFVSAKNTRATALALYAINCTVQERSAEGQLLSASVDGDDWNDDAPVLKHFGQWFEEAEGARKRIDAFSMEANNLIVMEAKKRQLTELQQQKWTAETDRELAAQSNCIREVLKLRNVEQEKITSALSSLILSQKVLGRMCGITVCSFQSQLREEMADMFGMQREPTTVTPVVKSEAQPSRRSISSLSDSGESAGRRAARSASTSSSRSSVSPAPQRKSVSSDTPPKEDSNIKPGQFLKTSAAVPPHLPKHDADHASQSSTSSSQPTSRSSWSDGDPKNRRRQSQSSSSDPSPPVSNEPPASKVAPVALPAAAEPMNKPTSTPGLTALALKPLSQQTDSIYKPRSVSPYPTDFEKSSDISKSSLAPSLVIHCEPPQPSTLNPFDVTETTNSNPDPPASNIPKSSAALNPFDDSTTADTKSKVTKIEPSNPFDSPNSNESSTNPFA